MAAGLWRLADEQSACKRVARASRGTNGLKFVMRLIARYKQLSAGERRLLLRALVVVAAVRLALWILPFRVTRHWVERLGKPPGPWRDLDFPTIRQTAGAIQAAGRRIRGATCLTQGMATQILLGRLGQRTCLHLGVARKRDGKFEAHAWVEAQGRIIIGDTPAGVGRFARFEKTPSPAADAGQSVEAASHHRTASQIS
jgi:hypothetical protein